MLLEKLQRKKKGGRTTPTVAAGGRTTPAATFTVQPTNIVGSNAGFINYGQPSNLGGPSSNVTAATGSFVPYEKVNPYLSNLYQKKVSTETGSTTSSTKTSAITAGEALSYFKGAGLFDQPSKRQQKSNATIKDSKKKSRKKNPATPAALTAHQGWTVLKEDQFEGVTFNYQSEFLDDVLTGRTIHYIHHFRQRFTDKLIVNLLEPTPVNVFNLLTSGAIECILEYTNESMNLNGHTPVSPLEFKRFIGTLLLSSTFTLSMDQSFSLMETLTGGCNIKVDRFRQILNNLKGYECSTRPNVRSTNQWDDQRNLLHNLHPLEGKMFERSMHFFFDRENGCYVYDDELLASKATDVELRMLSDRKAGGEGPTIDCLCDAFLQVVLGMRLRTTADTQQGNLEKLMDRFPVIEPNTTSLSGPILVMDRGFGKLKLVKALAKKNFKILTIAATAGSEHPLVPSRSLEVFLQKLKRRNKVKKYDTSDDDSEEEEPVVGLVDEFKWKMEQWTIPDDKNVLLGPEQKVAQYMDDNSLVAVAIRDIFDKKVAQKIIRFFMYGFPDEYLAMVNNWLVIPKVGLRPSLNTLFMSANPDDTTKLVEDIYIYIYIYKPILRHLFSPFYLVIKY